MVGGRIRYELVLSKGRSMAKGKIRKVIEGKDYGFIKAEDGREIFFNMSGLKRLVLKI